MGVSFGAQSWLAGSPVSWVRWFCQSWTEWSNLGSDLCKFEGLFGSSVSQSLRAVSDQWHHEQRPDAQGLVLACYVPQVLWPAFSRLNEVWQHHQCLPLLFLCSVCYFLVGFQLWVALLAQLSV